MWLIILAFVGALACNPVTFFAGTAEETERTIPQAGVSDITPPLNAPTPVVVNGKIGERVAAEGVAITVEKTEFSESVGESTPEEGKIFLLVHVLVENTNSAQPLEVSPGDFQVKSPNGDAVDFTPLDAQSDQLEDVQVAPGERQTGTLVFRVDKQLKDWHLLYDFNDQHIDIDLLF